VQVTAASLLKRPALGYLLVAVAASSWGAWPLILRHAPMEPALQAAIFMAAVTVGGIPFLLRDRFRVKRRAADWLALGWLGIGDAANTALFFAAYQRTSVAIAVLTHYLAPILVAVLAPFVLREKARERTFLAVFIAFSGLVLLLEPWRTSLSASDVVGGALGAGSAVFYASNVLVNKRLAKTFSGSELMVFHGLVALPLLLVLVPAHGFETASLRSIAIVAAGGLGPGILGGLFFVWGLQRIAASHASVLTLLEPFVALVLAVLFLGERLTALPLFGGLLILAGAMLVVTSRPGAVREYVDGTPDRDRVSSTP
jgi:drug/metabolite transporter (DMT)-like permease